MKTLKRSSAKVMVWHGMRLLKEKAPDVLKTLHLPTLDLADGFKCVLGQGFGLYSTGRDKLDLTNKEAEKYGFYIECDENWREPYSVLTEVWIEEILKDRKKHPKFYDL